MITGFLMTGNFHTRRAPTTSADWATAPKSAASHMPESNMGGTYTPPPLPPLPMR